MKENRLDTSTSGGKKVAVVSIILALVLAIISAIGVFAAPTQKGTSGDQISELNFARAWYNSARLNAANFIHTSDPVKAQQYLSQYAFALRQADAIVNGHDSSGNLAKWLRVMRGLRQKLVDIGFSANVNNGSNLAGAGVPVTGGTSRPSTGSTNPTATPGTGSSSSSPTPTATSGTSSSSSSGNSSSPTPTATSGVSSSSSSGSSSSPTPTATSGTSGSAGVPVTGNSAANNAAAQHNALAKVWGKQFRDLEAARTWYNNFRSNSKNFTHSSDPAKTQLWLSQYAFALRQADAIIAGRGMSTTKNQSSTQTSNGASVNRTTSAHQDLAGWLHMMRELREKLTGDANDPLGLND